jgi:hypothetical protein
MEQVDHPLATVEVNTTVPGDAVKPGSKGTSLGSKCVAGFNQPEKNILDQVFGIL